MIALLLAIALVWPAGTHSQAAENYLLSQAQAAHPGIDLILNPRLDRLAQRRAIEISRTFAHARFSTRLDDYGIRDWLLAGEVLVWNNYPTELSPPAAWSALMNSPSHRSIIVWGGYDAVGIGSWRLADGRMFYVLLYTDQVERRTTSPRWLRSSPWGTKLKLLPAGSRLVVFNHRRDAAGRLWVYVWANGRYGYVAAWGTRII